MDTFYKNSGNIFQKLVFFNKLGVFEQKLKFLNKSWNIWTKVDKHLIKITSIFQKLNSRNIFEQKSVFFLTKLGIS